MPQKRTLTVVSTPLDWEGLYLDDDLECENHTVSITDISLDNNEVIETIDGRSYSIAPLGLNSFPPALSDLEHLVEFGEKVKMNSETWREAIQQLFDGGEEDYVRQKDFEVAFGISPQESRVIGSLFSARQSPRDIEPLFKFDRSATREADEQAYTLVETSSN